MDDVRQTLVRDLEEVARRIRVHIDVSIGGYGSGLMYAGWGCTHHAMEEMALMRLIPTMTVLMPADAYETEQAVRAAAAADGPFYIALAGGTIPGAIPEPERSFEVGKAVLLRDGAAATLIAVGTMLPEALRAAELLAERGIGIRVLNMHTIKPLDRDAVLRAARETRLLVTLEEHTIVGGLGGAVAEVLADAGAGTRLRRLGVQDLFPVMSGNQQDFRARLGLSADAVTNAVVEGLVS
jgi:transketolase